jgi:UDP-N-acetylmuramoyl-L-alanyl-D-glutamate--2,6-diaminopimelate ligase
MAEGMTLAELGLAGRGALRVTGLSIDSRSVAPGYLFGALPGASAHGAAFAGRRSRGAPRRS